MGDFSMTCSLSGLGIDGGTAVRCLLLTASPYGNEDRLPWIVRTLPLRAKYNSYGSIRDIHPDDEFIAGLWLRGLREDLIEKGLGDNSVHDVPTAKDMSLEELLDALRAGSVEVRQDVRRFWMRPTHDEHEDEDEDEDDDDDEHAAAPLRRVEQVLRAAFPDAVARHAEAGKYVVDEPVPNMVRVRFGQWDSGSAHGKALELAREVVAAGGFVGVITAGSGRYAAAADLLVFHPPGTEGHVKGAQWDMRTGGEASPDKRLQVAMAMIREDVWQAMIAYPHDESVSLDCTTCGQEACYHERGRRCPNKSANGKPLKPHAPGSTYAHGDVFSKGVEHFIETRDFRERVWYGLDAYKAGTREAWSAVLASLSPRDDEPAVDTDATNDPKFDALMKQLEASWAAEAARIKRLPPKERAALEIKDEARRARRAREARRRKEHPCFGDFRIQDHHLGDIRAPGAWILRDSVPGVIGVSEHLSMCLADEVQVPKGVLDALAELSSLRLSMHAVGVQWKPAMSTGPQYPEWSHHVRFARTILGIAEAEAEACQDEEPQRCPVTLIEAGELINALKAE